MKRLAGVAIGLALLVGGILAASGGSRRADASDSSTGGTPITIVLSGTLTLIEERDER